MRGSVKAELNEMYVKFWRWILSCNNCGGLGGRKCIQSLDKKVLLAAITTPSPTIILFIGFTLNELVRLTCPSNDRYKGHSELGSVVESGYAGALYGGNSDPSYISGTLCTHSPDN